MLPDPTSPACDPFTVVHHFNGGSQIGIGLALHDDGLRCLLYDMPDEEFPLVVNINNRHLSCRVRRMSAHSTHHEGRMAHDVRVSVIEPSVRSWQTIIRFFQGRGATFGPGFGRRTG